MADQAAQEFVPKFEEIPEFAAPVSEAATITESQFETYEQMIQFFAGSQGIRTSPPPPEFFQGKAAVNLFKTFSSASETFQMTRQSDQWNPLAQRPVTGKFVRKNDHVASRFDDIASLLNSYIEVYHEMCHVMTWEPFFTGNYKPDGTASFFEFCSMSEGYAFFDADIVFTPTIRTRFPDGELLYQTSHVSMPQFHPYRAFKAAGIKNLRDIVGIYLDAFVGKPSRLDETKDNFSASLKRRIVMFHHTGAVPALPQMHRVLTVIGIFGEFFERFCAKKGIPSLFSDSLNAVLKNEGSRAYYMSLFDRSGKEIAALDEDTLSRVRARRVIQSRAYYGFELMKMIEYGWFVSNDDTTGIDALSGHVENYLNQLERALDRLISKKDVSEVLNEVEKADRFYDTNVRAFLKQKDVWAGERQQILPRMPVNTFSVGYDEDKPKAADHIVAACTIIQYELAQRILGKIPVDGSRPQEPESAAAEKIDKSQAVFAMARVARLAETVERDPANAAARKEFSEVLSLPAVLPVWSVPLWKFDPVNNRFEELLFNYA